MSVVLSIQDLATAVVAVTPCRSCHSQRGIQINDDFTWHGVIVHQAGCLEESLPRPRLAGRESRPALRVVPGGEPA